MNTQYQPTFLKDIKALKSTPYFEAIKSLVFEEVPNFATFEEIKNLKKLVGYENAYRLRVGDYRIGLIFDGDTVTFIEFCTVKISIAIFREFVLVLTFL